VTKPRPIRVVYFTPEFRATRNQIFLSQVLGQADALQAAGFQCMLIGSELNDQSIQHALAMPQLQALSASFIFPIYPPKPNSFRFYRLARMAAQLAESLVIRWKPDAIYVRDRAAFRPALKLARRVSAKVVYDARGLVAEESLLKRGKWNLLAYYHQYRELEACRTADRLLCVSERLRTYLDKQTGRKDILVVPCCVNEHQFTYCPDARHRIRQQLGWSDETPVVAYCGGLNVWQRIEDVLRLMVEMKSLESRLKCILLVPDPRKMSETANQMGLVNSEFHCVHAQNDAVPDLLSAADAGIILRHELLLNNVASPVKIAEYLACGLPVICSRGIGDLSDMIEDEQVGLVLDDGQPGHAFKALELVKRVHRQPSIRKRAQQLAKERLSWSSYVDTYRLCYGNSFSASTG
jgi:glycosyltransferase involved in cell wall biosynthesis